MTMGSLFDDLMGGVSRDVSLETDEPKQKPPVDTQTASQKSDQFLKIHRMPDGVRGKVDKLVEIMGHKDRSLQMGKMDYKIAHEIFAIIPEYVNAIQTSKLTRAPSAANSQMVRDALVKNTPVLEAEVVNELYSYYNELHGIYTQSKSGIEYVMNSVYVFKQEVAPTLQLVQDALILVMADSEDGKPRESINVKTDNLAKLNSIKLINIDCDQLRDELPYLIGHLNTPALLNLLMLVDPYGYGSGNMPTMSYGSISILDITRVIGAIVRENSAYMREFAQLEQIYEMLCNKLNNPETIVPAHQLEDAYRQYTGIVNTLVRYREVKTNFDSANSILDVLAKLLKLLSSI